MLELGELLHVLAEDGDDVVDLVSVDTCQRVSVRIVAARLEKGHCSDPLDRLVTATVV